MSVVGANVRSIGGIFVACHSMELELRMEGCFRQASAAR